MKRLIQILVIGLILALAINDGGKYGQGVIDLHNSADQALTQTTILGHGASAERIAQILGGQASGQGIRITQYSLVDNRLHIWAEEDVNGTWLIGPYMALAHGHVSIQQAFRTPLVITYDTEAAVK
jgi:hypothetical protein